MTESNQVLLLPSTFTDSSLSPEVINPNTQATVATSTDLVLRVAKDGTYLEVLASSHLLAELPTSQLVGKTVQDVFPPDCAHKQLRYIQQALTTKEIQTFEQQIAFNGELRYEEVQVIALNDHEVLLIVRDISTHRRIYEHLNLQYAVTRILTGCEVASREGIVSQLSQLLQKICEGLHWQYGELWTPDDRQQALHLMASWCVPGHELASSVRSSQRTQVLPGEGFIGKVWASHRPNWLENIGSSGHDCSYVTLATHAGLHTVVGVPIVSNDQLLGIILLGSTELRRFDATLVETMQAIGYQIGQFIERTRFEVENRRQTQLAQLLALITLRIRESLDIQSILNTTVAEVRQFLDTQRVIVYQFTPGWNGRVIVESVADGWQSILHRDIYDTCFSGVYTQRYQQGLSRAIDNVKTAGLDPCYLAMVTQLQVQASLVVPIVVSNNLWGLLIAHHCASPRPWQPWEIDFLEKLAVQVGVGIQQADLYLQLSTELKERRQTEIQLIATLQELEQQKFALDEAAMVTRLDAKGLITYVNNKFCEVSQYSRAEIIGKPYQAAIGVEQTPEFLQSIRDRVMNGHVWHGEVENRAKDGRLYWTDTTVVPFLNSAGQPVEYLTIRFDITDRKVFQEQLRAIQNRLQYLLASSPAIIYTRRPEKLETIVFVSPNVHHLLGWTCVQLTHSTDMWVSLIHPDDRQAVLADLTRLTSTHHLVLEYRLQHENGSYCWIRDEMRMLTNDRGQPLECIGSMIDVTDRHVAEEQVLKALEQERELSNLKSRFVCNTSHEFRTPLATIFAASDLLKRFGHKLSEEKKQERLDKIQAEVKHMTRLLEDVLLLGKVSEGQYRFEPVLINLVTFCRDLLQETELLVGQTHTLELQCQGDDFSILADPALLKQLVNNLLSNAVKYSPQGGTVTLRLIHKTDHVVLQVSDQGIGIAQSDIEHLFEDFFRAGNVGNLPGTGLGLAIVKQAVDLHGGTISIESELGQGTVVTVCLPIGVSNQEML